MGKRFHGVKRLPPVAGMIGFLARLKSDTGGNVLAIVAACTIPVAAMVGSGVDISRAYMAKTRLQQACDAGVIAGRKVMTPANGVDSVVTTEVRKYVNFDFPQGSMGTTAFAINPTLGASTSVDLTLSTSVPTSIMKILGFTTIPISTSCTARQDLVNTDVMLVLDTTLSMNCLPSDDANTYCTSEKTNSKIDALRAGVLQLYDTLAPAQAELKSAGLRLRYAMVPYSVTVNTGGLVYALSTSYIRNPSTYRVSGGGTTNFTHPTSFFTNTNGFCIEERQTVTTINQNSGYTIPSGATDLDIDTAPTATASSKWAPYDPAVETAKTSTPGINYACPAQSFGFKELADHAAMNTEMNKLNAGGYTYHDIGLIWAARLMSQTGLWATNNPTSFNSFPVTRHMIFMTDGAMDPDEAVYSAYGIEQYDHRVNSSTNATNQYNSHLQRFRMMCNKIKSMNVSVWVIAFGTSAGTGLSQDMINCASNPSQAFKADDQATLLAKFQQIAESIGALRLSR